MAIAASTSVPGANQPPLPASRSVLNSNGGNSTWLGFLDPAIFGLFILFVATLPHSIKGAERAWKIAFVLWLLKLAIARVRPFRQPLVAPLLAYVTFSTISTMLSPDPYLSWDRMKFVCLFLVGVVFAQNLKRLSQVRWLLALLVLSGLAAALYTGWQYTYGVGVRLAEFPPGSRLSQAGFVPGDVITSFAGHQVYAPGQLIRAVEESPFAQEVNVEYFRGLGFHKAVIVTTSDDFLLSGLGTGSVKLDRGKPIRAQGTLGHYVVFAEMLTQIGCMAWALLLSTHHGQTGWKLLLAVAFAGITVALLATATRAAIGGLALGGGVSLVLLLGSRKARVAAIAALIVMLIGATLWIQHSRGLDWLSRGDVGTHFRVLMWEDGIRLVREHPWFGVGMETVRVHYREWNIRGFIQYNVMSHFHSTFLQIAVERGIPALLAWVWFSVAYFLFLVRLLRRLGGQNRFASGVAIGALAAFVAFTFTSFVHYNLGEEPLAMIFFFYFGIALALDRMAETPGAMDIS
jgi:O-antigen ligase